MGRDPKGDQPYSIGTVRGGTRNVCNHILVPSTESNPRAETLITVCKRCGGNREMRVLALKDTYSKCLRHRRVQSEMGVLCARCRGTVPGGVSRGVSCRQGEYYGGQANPGCGRGRCCAPGWRRGAERTAPELARRPNGRVQALPSRARRPSVWFSSPLWSPPVSI